MAVLRLTYPEKTNNPSDADIVRKFHATEANEVKNVLDNHADEIEAIKGALVISPNPNYGIYSSLALLEAAYPLGELNAYATIDVGPGITPQIAIWDNLEGIWKISGYTDDTIEVQTFSSLPLPGTEGKWYITKNDSKLYRWYNGQYNLMNSGIISQPGEPKPTIDVSAIWTGTGLDFDVIANSFPVNDIMYSATPGVITLNDGVPSLDRIDLIVGEKPTIPATIGTVGKITGTPASTALVVPPDYDPSRYYVIKQITVKAGATTPDGFVNTQVYDEGVEFVVTLSANAEQNTSQPSQGVNCIEAENWGNSDYIIFTSPTTLSTADIDLLSFDLKLKTVQKNKYIGIILLNGPTIVSSTYFRGNNYVYGFNDQNLNYQTITLSGFGGTSADFNAIKFVFLAPASGFYLDNVKILKGSGAEPDPEQFITDAPIDGVLRGRRNGAWESILGHGFITPEDYGAAGDGITDDTDSIIEALSNNDKLFLKKIYLVSSTIDVTSNKMIFGLGQTSKIITNTNASIIHIKGSNNTFANFSLYGSGKDAGLTSQNGIYLDSEGSYINAVRKGNMITNVRFDNLAGSGFLTRDVRGIDFSGGALLTGCFANSCNVGFESALQGEYSCFSNCSAVGSNIGLQIRGGNINFIGGQLVGNDINFHLVGGSNDAHCTISSTKINHPLTRSVKISGVSNGFRINNCDIYAGKIEIEDSDKIVFDNCFIDFSKPTTGRFDLSILDSEVVFQNNKIITNPNTYSSIGSDVKYLENNFVEGVFAGVNNYSLLELFTKNFYINKGANYGEIGIKRTVSGVEYSASLAINGVQGNAIFGSSRGPFLELGESGDMNGLRYYDGTKYINIKLTDSCQKYTAIISQSGTGNPTVTVLENTLGGTVSWVRTGVGVYTGTLNAAFPSNKGFYMVGSGDNTSDNDYRYTLRRTSNNVVAFTSSILNVSTDGITILRSIKIEIYP